MGSLSVQIKKSVASILSLLLVLTMFLPAIDAVAADSIQSSSESTEQSFNKGDVKGEVQEDVGIEENVVEGISGVSGGKGDDVERTSFSSDNPSRYALFDAAEVSVSVRIEGLGKTIVPPMHINVSAYDISHAIGGAGGVTSGGPRAIHAIVKALELQKFDVADNNNFDFGGGNFITNIDGLKMNSVNPGMDGWMYFVNNEFAPVGVGDFELKENDSVVMYFVPSYFANTYTWFDKELVEVNAGEDVQLTLTGDNYGTVEPVTKVEILVNDELITIDGKPLVTDVKGVARLQFDTPGEYHVSAQRIEDRFTNITRPYSKVIVLGDKEEEIDPPQLQATQTIEAGTVNPSVTITLVGDTFKTSGVTELANWTLEAGTTGLELDEVIFETDQKATLKLKGKAQAGTLSFTALADALVGNKNSEAIALQIDPVVKVDAGEILTKTLNYYTNERKNFKNYYGKVGLSWTEIVALNAAGFNLTDGDLDIPSWVTKDPNLNENEENTDHIRYIYGLLALGEDPSRAWETDRNLFAELAAQQKEDGSIGSINKHIWAMLALDAGEKIGYNVGKWNVDTKDKALAYLLSQEKQSGGFALSLETTKDPEADMTGMALLTLANYQSDSAVNEAIKRAKSVLLNMQLDTAGWGAWGSENASSIATVISGLVAIGEDPLSETWKKNKLTPLDALEPYQLNTGVFEPNINMIATEQSIIALTEIKTGKSVWQQLAEQVLPEPEESDNTVEVKESIKSVTDLILQNGVTSEWTAIGLARAGVQVPASYLNQFQEKLKNQVLEMSGTGKLKVTDVERLTIAAAAIGVDARNADGNGFSLIEKIHTSEHWTWENTDSIIYQGNNGIIFALIALDAKDYYVPSDAKWTREKLVAELLNNQKEDGSWSLSTAANGSPSFDITAMALISLAPYTDDSVVKEAVDKAVSFLSNAQDPTGGFDEAFVGGISSEATSQVVIGLTANRIDPRGEQFTKNGINLIDHLLSFKAADGGFKHTSDDTTSNGMATEQALQGLVAFDLFVEDKGRLYEFGQEVLPEPEPTVDTEALQKLIESAEQRLIDTTEGTKAGQFTADSRTILEDKITTAKTFIELGKSQEEVNAALDDLTKAVKTYNESVIPEESKPVPPPVHEDKKVTFSVEKRTMGQGDIISPMQATLRSGDTAFTLLKREVEAQGISIAYIGSGGELYVQAINELGEFDGGPLSGWMYSVNGIFPNHSAGTYVLKDGDVLRWQYTTNLGEDLDNTWKPDPTPDPDPTPEQPKPESPEHIQAPEHVETIVKDGKLQIQVKDKTTGEMKPAHVENSQMIGSYLIVQIGDNKDGEIGELPDIELPPGESKIVIIDNDKPYNYFEGEDDAKTKPMKEWKVSFSQPFLDEASNLEKVMVQDASGNNVEIKVTLSKDGKTVIITPDIPYKKGELYYMTIADAKSASGKIQTTPVRKIFIVE